MNNLNTVKKLVHRVRDGQAVNYCLFYGHIPKNPRQVDRSCFSQWYPSPFVVEGVTFRTAEHYMMAEKAKLFCDAETLDSILAVPDPKTAKAFGRCVKNFSDELWNQHREDILIDFLN